MELRKACQAIANITALNKGDYSCGQCQSLTCRKSVEARKVVQVAHLFAFTVTLAILVYDPASANGTWKSPETGDCPAKAGAWAGILGDVKQESRCRMWQRPVCCWESEEIDIGAYEKV